MKIGLLGFGFMGRAFMHSLNNLNDYYNDVPKNISVKGVATSSISSSKSIDLERYNIEKIYNNSNHLLEDNDIDSIYIASPNKHHYEHIIKAIKKNKNILCDKPLTINYKQSNEIAKKISNKKVFQILFEYRNIPAIRKIKELLEKNKIGKIINFRINYLHSGYLDRQRPMSWRLRNGGGALVDLGPHVLDLTNFLLGEIKYIKGIKTNHINKRYTNSLKNSFERVSVDDYAMGVCETKSGVLGMFEVSRLSMGSIDDLNIHISGEKGSIKWSLEELNFYEISSTFGTTKKFASSSIFDTVDFPPSKVSHGWLRAHAHSVYQFIKQVNKKLPRKEKKFVSGFYDSLIVQKQLESFNSKKKFFL